jgi:hypothetical protein
MPRVGTAKVYPWFLDLGTNVISGELVLAASIWTGEPGDSDKAWKASRQGDSSRYRE